MNNKFYPVILDRYRKLLDQKRLDWVKKTIIRLTKEIEDGQNSEDFLTAE